MPISALGRSVAINSGPIPVGLLDPRRYFVAIGSEQDGENASPRSRFRRLTVRAAVAPKLTSITASVIDRVG